MQHPSQDTQSVLIPLNRLKRSPKNVRQEPHREAHIRQLAATLVANGQLQNLIVEPEVKGERETGHYLVNAGEARRLALLSLAKSKQIKADHPVRCLIDTQHVAEELSLIENTHRAPMSPIDEFEAIRNLCERGHGVEEITARMGLTPLVVQRRLKLANVCPDFLTMYRREELSMDHLIALACVEDHERQKQVWAALPPYNRHPAQLRDALLAAEVPQSSALARFVGEAYAKAGGQVRQDLFSDEEEGFIVDADLLNRLAAEKLAKAAARIKKEGFAWVDTALSLTSADRATFSRARSILREATEDEAARLKALAEETEQIESEIEALDVGGEEKDEHADALEERLDAIQEEEQAIEEARTQIDPKHQAVAGALVSIGHNGKLCVERGLIRAADRKRFAAEGKESDASAGGTENRAPQGPHSAAFTRALTAHRTLALQVELARQPHVALAALTTRMIAEAFRPMEGGIDALDINARHVDLSAHDATLKSAKAYRALDEHRETLLARVPQEGEAMLSWLLAQPQPVVLELLALCVAMSLNGVQSQEGDSPLDALARAAALDMRDWWTADVSSYFKHVPKAHIASVVAEAVPGEATRSIALLKKADAAALAEQKVAGTGWLPSVLRTPTV